MNHIKRLWGHYLALTVLIIILAFPIYWIYRLAQNSLGKDVALLSLTVTIGIVVIFGVRGAVHTHRIIRILRQEITDSNEQPILVSDRTKIPLVLKIFRMDQPHCTSHSLGESSVENAATSPHLFLPFPRKRRGKQPRFPEEKIRKAVLKWESRDPSYSALTLEEFLAQEFGSTADGVLLMAATTFYDWRRRMLKEIESHEP